MAVAVERAPIISSHHTIQRFPRLGSHVKVFLQDIVTFGHSHIVKMGTDVLHLSCRMDVDRTRGFIDVGRHLLRNAVPDVHRRLVVRHIAVIVVIDYRNVDVAPRHGERPAGGLVAADGNRVAVDVLDSDAGHGIALLLGQLDGLAGAYPLGVRCHDALADIVDIDGVGKQIGIAIYAAAFGPVRGIVAI